MKSKYIIAALVAISASVASAKAQNDTTLVRSSNIRFETETFTSDKGNTSIKYWAIVEGNRYESNKTSAERYATIKRFGGQPCVCKVRNPKSRKERIVTL